jgi:DNA replication protein DnaC
MTRVLLTPIEVLPPKGLRVYIDRENWAEIRRRVLVPPRGAKEEVDHLGFLSQSCELELLDREQRAAARRLNAARFPAPKGLDGFDFTAAPSANKLLILELKRCEYFGRLENVILVGGSGSEKMHVATALANEACTRAKRVRFFRVTELASFFHDAILNSFSGSIRRTGNDFRA